MARTQLARAPRGMARASPLCGLLLQQPATLRLLRVPLLPLIETAAPSSLNLGPASAGLFFCARRTVASRAHCLDSAVLAMHDRADSIATRVKAHARDGSR